MGKWIDGRSLRRGALLPLACVLAALAAVTLAAGCGGSGGGETASVPTRKVVKVQHEVMDRWTYARARFREMCAGCHTLGDARATGSRYNLDRSAAVDEAHVRYTILEGEPGMPAWRDVLAEREFEELVAYVSTVARHQRGDDYWHRQIELRTEGNRWSPEDTRRLEAYARRLVRETR